MSHSEKVTELTEKARKHISPVSTRVTELIIDRGKGARFWTKDGEEYIDFVSGVAVNALGHSHERIVNAIKTQAERLVHFGLNYGYYETVIGLAEKLAQITPGNLDTVFFSNSGGEAIDGALKLARAATDRPGIIAFNGSFHGRTLGATTVTGSSSKYKKYYEPLVGEVYHTPYPYPGLVKNIDNADLTNYCINQLRSLFDLHIDPSRVAAILVEPVLGEGGYYPAPPLFLQELRSIADEHGILLIFDEVQTGFGRTGRMFASEHSGVTPDILVLAKALSGGLPLGAIVANRDLHNKWPVGGHGSTFGGNPISCAAALASIQVIEEENLVKRSKELGEQIVNRLQNSLLGYEPIKEVRGIGMMIGIEFNESDKKSIVPLIKARCLDKHLLIMNCGVNGQTIRLMLPLNISTEELDAGLTILETVIGDVVKEGI
ncbi:aminotransferase class III-fold pyridoxal phosphate-dependent enzyme [Pradoshia sp. D12]|uniref:aminotransferase class III-fold pyridoxal phosphate-dependent enzyme n=1 Tax=Bacillaceae TaxID=186817 RepID=UPI00112B17BE|nr:MULTISPECIES: aminotransferase class III-fold pyridoxal phosphate-dependent enzyme [Bacillaceae]QFK71508.1 aminotransferase class III-fold pyridoxal phosphate-dependent enzyme [Pradoshia sp. D12]TPF73303.1 aminotransferase class III-fold pyridoxal phosphate-dependent enzyme [Bacillus sp. D12]